MLNASIVWAVISATVLLSSAETCTSLVIRSPTKSYRERKNFSRLECSTAVFPKENVPVKSRAIKILPCGDQLDMRILKLAVPAVCNFLILPLVGAVDTFWVGRMGNALSLAGQGAANQVFSSSFFEICSIIGRRAAGNPPAFVG